MVTGTTKTPGHWRGIGVLGGRVELVNAIIEYGGGAIIGLGGQKPANLQLTTGAANTLTTLNMQSTVLRGSAEYGLYARAQQVVIEAFAAGNALLQNNAPVYIASTLVDRIEGGLFTGNAVDAIVVNTGGAEITSDATWRDLGVPYLLEDGGPAATPIFRVQGATLTMEPGVQVMLPSNMGLEVRNGGLNATGLSGSPVVLRNATGASWRGINLFDSMGTFDYFEIHNGGSLTWSTAGAPGSITVTTGNASNPPESSVALTSNVVFSGTQWSLVFASGDTYATGCPASGVYVPAGDQITDHCR
jgi:hypothetical protein